MKPHRFSAGPLACCNPLKDDPESFSLSRAETELLNIVDCLEVIDYIKTVWHELGY